MKRRFEKRPYWERPLDLFKLFLTLGGILALGLGWLNGCVSVPAVPRFETPALLAGNRAFVNGVGTPGSTIHLYRNGLDVGMTQVNANGKWQIMLPEATAGEYKLTARASANLADVESKPITVQVAALGTVANAPLILTPLGGTLFAPDGQFGEINGKAVPNSTLAIYDGDTKLTETKTDATGAWRVALPAMGLGAHVLTARMTQADGSLISSWPANVVVEPAAPQTTATKVAAEPTTARTVVAANEVTAATPTAMAAPAATSTVQSNAAPTAQPTKATGSAVQSATATTTQSATTPSATATVSATVSATGSATGSAQATAVAVSAPVFAASVQGSRFAANQISSVAGSAAPNSTVQVFAGERKLGTAQADASGNWVLPVSDLAIGKYVLTAQDEAGKLATETTISVAAAPVTPVITNIINGQQVSSQAPTEIAGTAPAASTVEVFAGEAKIGEAKANARGRWKLETTTPLAAGKQVLHAVAKTAEGMHSADSTVVNVESTLTPLLPTTGGGR